MADIDYNKLTPEQKTSFLEKANADKNDLSSSNELSSYIFQGGLLWSRISLELVFLEMLIEVPEIIELPEIELKIQNDKEKDSSSDRDILDLFANDWDDVSATITLNKYSSVGEAMRKVLPLFYNFDVIKKHTDYLWSVHSLDEIDFENLNLATCFRAVLLNSCYRFLDIKNCLLKMSSIPCYLYFEENTSYVSVQPKIILCLQGLLKAFDHMKALYVDAQQMKRLSIFMKLENIYPTVNWINIENEFLRRCGFCSGGDFSYGEYLNRLVNIFRELNTIFLNFWEGFLSGDEEIMIWEGKIQSWLKKSEFYFKTEGKLFDGIVTEPTAFSYSLATASAFRAYSDSSLFFKDMMKIVERRVDYKIDVEPCHIDESLLKFAAKAELTFSTGYEIEDMFGDLRIRAGKITAT